MWTRKMLKNRAKNVLRKNYGILFWAFLFFGFLGGVFSVIMSLSNNSNLSTELPSFFIILSVFSFIFSVFVLNVIRVGLCRFLMQTRRNRPNLSTIFWGFQRGIYPKIVITMFFYNLYIFLWSLLFIIPGIVKMYQYYYVPFILAEKPEMETNQVLQSSRNMTQGEKIDIFVLNLSFLGWIILGLLCFGIGVYFLTPYIEATNAELYAFARGRSKAQNNTDGF